MIMKLLKNKKIVGVVVSCVVLIAVMLMISVTSDKGVELPIADTQSTETAKLETIANRRAVTRNTADSETEPPATQSRNGETANTEPPVVEITLAPVEVPDERVAAILEENDVQVVPPAEPMQTKPPRSEQRSPDTTTYINGQKYTWDPIICWIRSSGDGQMIIMDVEDDGRRYEGGW